MKTAYENQELRKEKISSGYLRPSMFTWEKTAEKMLKIYQKK
jgi:glycosyltransferase involved in cell wall biosynthesis